MRIERVTARAFGPLVDETLELAPGMTVIVGPNEAGKTSWHAAIRAAVCGMRRGRGAVTRAEQDFANRHRPWDLPDRWEVEARLALDDGRTIELSQDLAGKVACRAVDVGLGRDVSDEIMDGTPDASRWLGLDRDAFATTICVGQAQILAIAERDTAAALQEHMQRAAATRGTDGTAAEARARITAYRRDHVGLDRANARGPLRGARVRLEQARAALDEARRRHGEYLDIVAAGEASQLAAQEAGRRVTAIEAALARQHALAARRRAERATELTRRHPSAPGEPAGEEALAGRVAAALHGWAARPRPQRIDGASSADLEQELAALPPMPAGDSEVHPTVAAARRELDLAVETLRHDETGPHAEDVDTAGLDEDELRTLARRLRTPLPPPVPELEAELAAARSAMGATGSRGAVVAIAAGVGLAVVGVVALVAGLGPVAGALLAAGLASVAAGWLRGPHGGSAAALRLARAEAAIAPTRAAANHARSERAAAAAQLEAAGLPVDADALDSLADRAARAARTRAEREAWQRRRDELVARRRDAERRMTEALAARGEPADARYEEYEDACRRRAEQARAASRRDPLQRTLAARRAAEEAQRAAEETAAAAERALLAAATQAGVVVDGRGPAEVAVALRDWQTRRAEMLRGAADALREWQELSGLLDGRTLDDVRAEAEERAARADQLARLGDEESIAAFAGRDDLEVLLSIEREEHARAQREALSRAGTLEQMRGELPDVAEAEERLAEAESEARRVNALAGVLDETLRLLRSAEERVHRDLAPILAEGIRRWLPSVSHGRYVDASVDPADLAVRVKEAASGRWRSALLLSEGTREQIYLLLRVAMAQHLVTTHETAPLLLDEVTAQADRARAERLLEALHQLSAERQVILFTHDERVVAWARGSLSAPRDALVELPAGRVARPAAATA